MLKLLCMGDLAFVENHTSYDPQFPAADLGTGNVEIVISDTPGPPGEKLVHLLAGETTAEAYSRLGLDVVTLANNHTLDYGPEGLTTTIEALQRSGLQIVGAGANAREARTPVIINSGGLTVGFIGITCVVPPGSAATRVRPGTWAIRIRSYLETETSNEQPGAAPFVHTLAEAADVEQLRAELSALRDQVDISVMHVHWGVPPPWQTPFQGRLATYQRQLISDLNETRPDVVIGHHPHVVQGMEWFAGTLVMYSLGHLVFQPWGRTFATSPDDLILNKAEQMGAATLHPPYESLEDDRNWDGCACVIDIETTDGKSQAVACHIYPYEIDKQSGLGIPAVDAKRASSILDQIIQHTQLLSPDIVITPGVDQKRPYATFRHRERS